MDLIEIRDLSVFYGRQTRWPALANISLAIAENERVAIMGPSGSGKSTLLSVIGGLMRPNSGSCLFRGVDLAQMSPAELAAYRGEQVGFVFQNFSLLPHLTLTENLLVPIEHLPGKARDAIPRAHALLDRVGILELADRFPGEVSGGQAQRAAIARAMMRAPPLILADEPTGSLDDDSAAEVLALLNSLANEGTTIVVVTHSQQVEQSMARTIHVDAGRIRATADLAL